MAWLRNYKAMGDEKLRRTIAQFDKGYGEAVTRVKDKDGDIAENRAKAEYEARLRGLIDSTNAIPEGTLVYTAAQFCPSCERKRKFILDDYICEECRKEIDG